MDETIESGQGTLELGSIPDQSPDSPHYSPISTPALSMTTRGPGVVSGRGDPHKHLHVSKITGDPTGAQGYAGTSDVPGIREIQERLAGYVHDGVEPTEGHEDVAQQPRADIEPKPGEIQREVWQSEIDQAFQSGDYETVGTLERVLPEVRPTAELVQARVHTIVTTRKGEWGKEYLHIKSVAHIDPDDPIFAEEFGKLFAQFGKQRRILEGLVEFKEVTGYTPPEEVVQAKYRSIITSDHKDPLVIKDFAREIRELTDIAPDRVIFDEIIDSGDLSKAMDIAFIFGVKVTEEMAQKAFAASLERDGRLSTYTIKASGFKPSEETVQQAYERIMTTAQKNSQWVRQLQELEEVTGVKPRVTQEQVEPIYREYLSQSGYGREGYELIEQIMGITGIRPSPELIQQVAVRAIGGNLRDPEKLQATLTRLESSTGIKVEIPPEQIQEVFQSALAKKDYQAIITIFTVLGVKPEVDPEAARLFMVSYIDQSYDNPIESLQDVFGIEFHATPEEVAAKYQENYEKLNFRGINAIHDITGVAPDRDRLLQVVLAYTRKMLTERQSGNRYSYDWTTSVKLMVDKYQVVIPQEQVTACYERCIDRDVDTQTIAQLNSLFGTNIPPELAQKAYQKIFRSNQLEFYSPGATIESVYELSGGIKPELPTEQVQEFYLRCLNIGLTVDTDSVKRISAITGIEPHFDPQTINTLYMELLLSGRVNNIKSVKELTGIEFVIDDQTRHVASQAVDQQIAKIIEKEYVWDNLDSDRIRNILITTGIAPNQEVLHAYYRSLLADSPRHWSEKI
ncbi:MAG: hypothetical protein UZ21_OP11001000455 [Microgenomates bacterium OLB22]|nr:MAG: hypothetical protein UZ21_OP11001000455 [Microgenomates bacterium OLB22]